MAIMSPESTSRVSERVAEECRMLREADGKRDGEVQAQVAL